jgi:hypothetical protein
MTIIRRLYRAAVLVKVAAGVSPWVDGGSLSSFFVVIEDRSRRGGRPGVGPLDGGSLCEALDYHRRAKRMSII